MSRCVVSPQLPTPVLAVACPPLYLQLHVLSPGPLLPRRSVFERRLWCLSLWHVFQRRCLISFGVPVVQVRYMQPGARVTRHLQPAVTQRDASNSIRAVPSMRI